MQSSVVGGVIGDHVLSATRIEVTNNGTASRESSPTKKSPNKAETLIEQINESRKSVDKILTLASEMVETIKDRNQNNVISNIS